MRDAELLRRLLLPPEGALSKWTLLGQSFGGFCCVTYLSFAPEGALPCFPSFRASMAAPLIVPCTLTSSHIRADIWCRKHQVSKVRHVDTARIHALWPHCYSCCVIAASRLAKIPPHPPFPKP